MKKIYIVLMQTNTIPNKLISFFTRYEYGHVGISLNKNCDEIYSFGRRKVHSIINGGFTIERKDGPFFTFFKNTTCKIYEVDVNCLQYIRLKKIVNDMKKNSENYDYDLLGIILRFFKIPYTRDNKYVCSYFVAYVLEKSGIYKFNKKACLVTPKDFSRIKIFKEIYTGKYSKYNKNYVIM